jgi:hypothetical protein
MELCDRVGDAVRPAEPEVRESEHPKAAELGRRERGETARELSNVPTRAAMPRWGVERRQIEKDGRRRGGVGAQSALNVPRMNGNLQVGNGSKDSAIFGAGPPTRTQRICGIVTRRSRYDLSDPNG